MVELLITYCQERDKEGKNGRRGGDGSGDKEMEHCHRLGAHTNPLLSSPGTDTCLVE